MTRFLTSTAVLILTVSFSLTGCRWTEGEKKKFEQNCTLTDTVNNIVVEFRGFDNNEFDSVLVREHKNTTLPDSFKIYVWPAQDPWSKENKRRSATITRTMNTKYWYEFLVPGQRPYKLTNMKMIMWAQFTMTSEGYGCVMGDYTLDGKEFKHNANPCFEKRDTINKK